VARLAALSIVVPFHDEEENIEATVERIHEAFPSFVDHYEIILVDDGSTDRTGHLADRLAADDPRIRAIHHPANLGYGAALRSGFSAARHDLIFYTDGDLQFDLKEFPLLLPLIETADIASGYRANRQDPWHRRFNGRLFNLIMGLLFGLWFRDIDCAFKIYRRRVFESLQLRSSSILIDAEIYILARRQGMTIKEIAVSHYPRTRGTNVGNSPKVVAGAIIELAAFCLRMLFTRSTGRPR
jgi:glycosyltransferase involved in cell wall biosynthesis